VRIERAGGAVRCVTGVVATAVVCGLSAGAAHADESNAHAHDGPRIALVDTGQVDDPMEDVLEHTLLFGDGYSWN
jgi:hypothetical protein